jgi:hypothetical protein
MMFWKTVMPPSSMPISPRRVQLFSNHTTAEMEAEPTSKITVLIKTERVCKNFQDFSPYSS